MFVRDKRIGPYTYVYLVETVREDGRVKQRILRNLGRTEEVDRRGDLDRLGGSPPRLAQRSLLLSALDEGTAPQLAWRSVPCCSPPSMRALLPSSPAGASARRCCSNACGATPDAARCCMSCSAAAASGLPSSAPSSSLSCTG